MKQKGLGYMLNVLSFFCHSNCSDYDLCEFCESQHNVHTDGHVFLKLRKPCKNAGLNKKGVAKPLLKKSIYSQFSDDDDSYSDCSDVLVAVGSKEHSGGKKKKLTKGKKWKKQKIQNIENVMSKLAQKLEVLAAQRDSDSAEETRDSMETSKTPEKLR